VYKGKAESTFATVTQLWSHGNFSKFQESVDARYSVVKNALEVNPEAEGGHKYLISKIPSLVGDDGRRCFFSYFDYWNFWNAPSATTHFAATHVG